jgi:hypothetical protein
MDSEKSAVVTVVKPIASRLKVDFMISSPGQVLKLSEYLDINHEGQLVQAACDE